MKKGDKSYYSEFLGTNLIYNIHAIERSIERSITEEEILNLVENKNTYCIRQPNGRFRLESDDITVILQYDNGNMRIVTVFLHKSNRKEKKV